MTAPRVTLRDLRGWIACADGTCISREEHDAAKCPDCGAVLVIDEAAETLDPVTRARGVARVAFCTGCEFVHAF